MNYLLNMAVEIARKADNRYRVGAIGRRRDGALVFAKNTTCIERFPRAHAEARLIRKLGVDAEFVLVIRLNKHGELAMAKPCSSCQLFLNRSNVKTIYYTNSVGAIERL